MEKFLQNLGEAEKSIRTLDHMLYVTFPLIKDKKLLLKIILEIKKAVADCINSILHYEYLYKRISLYKDMESNFRTFKERCAVRYGITKDEIRLINELFEIVKKHKESPFEFMKNNKIVILSENLEPKTITLEKIKVFLQMAKEFLRKTKEVILRKV